MQSRSIFFPGRIRIRSFLRLWSPDPKPWIARPVSYASNIQFLDCFLVTASVRNKAERKKLGKLISFRDVQPSGVNFNLFLKIIICNSAIVNICFFHFWLSAYSNLVCLTLSHHSLSLFLFFLLFILFSLSLFSFFDKLFSLSLFLSDVSLFLSLTVFLSIYYKSKRSWPIF